MTIEEQKTIDTIREQAEIIFEIAWGILQRQEINIESPLGQVVLSTTSFSTIVLLMSQMCPEIFLQIVDSAEEALKEFYEIEEGASESEEDNLLAKMITKGKLPN